jgi:hypothetical protein
MTSRMQHDLGAPAPRDPDALPPRNAFERAMNVLYFGFAALGHGNVQFALKAGLLTSERKLVGINGELLTSYSTAYPTILPQVERGLRL